MTYSSFNVRRTADYGVAHTTYAASKWDEETAVIYLLGRRPAKYFDAFNDPESPKNETFNKFISDQGITDVTQDVVAEAAALELSKRVVTEELVNKVAQDIETAIANNPSRELNQIVVICPFPIDPDETGNEFAPALAAMLTGKLVDSEKFDLPIVCELDLSHDEAILNVVNNDRGSTSDPEEGKEGLVYSERLIRQPVYTGQVNQNAIYIPVDDFLVAQSTLAGLMSYIQSNGGVTTNAVTGCQLFTGINVMAVQPETLEYLNAVAGDEENKQALKALMERVGLIIDFDDPAKNTVSNVEMMFVAGVLADSSNPEHKTTFEKMLAAIGSSPEEAAGNSPSDIFYAAPMTVPEVAAHFESVLEVRKPLLNNDHDRIQSLAAMQHLAHF